MSHLAKRLHSSFVIRISSFARSPHMPRLLLLLSLPLYILDQITKFWIVAQFPLGSEGRVVIDDFFTIHHIANTGIAFGNFNGGAYSNYIFGIVAVLALGGITWAYRKGLFSGPYSRLA